MIAPTQQLDDAVEQVPGAKALGGGHGQRLAQAEAMELGGQRQLGDAVALVGGDDARQRGAAQQVGDLLIARTHARAGVDHEHGHLRVGQARARLLADRAGQRVLVSKSTPPVSISLKVRPFHSQSSSLRSRVTPGRSCTTASRVPVRRLISEDLPTFG